MTVTPKKPFSMIREFQLADWFTLANAVCGIGALFSIMTYLELHDVKHIYFACSLVVVAPTSILLVFILALAAWFGAINQDLWFGEITLAGFKLHPLVLLFALSGSLMISRFHIPKP